MKQHILSNGYGFFEVPEGAVKFKIRNGQYIKKLLCEFGLVAVLDFNHWRIIGLAAEATEEQAKGVCTKKEGKWYWDYETEDYDVLTALESLHSFIRSKGMSIENTIILFNNLK